MKFSSKIEKCGLSPMRKFHPYAVAAEAKGRKIYHLNIGQPDIETPKAYFDAVKNFELPVLEYAPSPGMPVLIDAIQNYYDKLDIHFEKSDILVTTGGSEALQIVLQCILDDGDEILIPEPFYPNYNTFVRVTGGSIHPIPTTPEEGYHYADRKKIEAEINEHTRAIMVTNPGNPTGVVLTPEEMRMIADVAKEHNLFVIGDEVYREFVYGGEALASMAQFPDAADNVVVIDSVSKRFSACGARIGVLISRNKELMAQAMKCCQGRLCSATLDQVGAAALYSVGPDYFAKVRDEYKKRRDAIMAKLEKIPGVVCKCPKGAFYIMAKLPVDNADTFQIWLLEHFEDHGDTVMFAPGEGFYGTPNTGKDEIRIAYVLKQADLERAMDVLAAGIKAYNAK
ncbi:MAG: pyridoxal phosphate-dependent aminotransferase [Oscillospiraceae bacterium]